MTYNKDTITDITIAYIGGGSKGWAWTFMKDLALEPALSGTIRLYDIDREAAKDNAVIGNRINAMEESLSQWDYQVTETLRDSLDGADFVVISILPGSFDEMDVDVHLPETYGIYQSVGDTVGPGGLMRGLRTIPMYVEIAEAIKAHAPTAWVINYTNPMSLCVKTLYDVFPDIKAFGCCHEVFGTQEVLKGICEEKFNLSAIDRRDIHVNVLGINHFTWFDYASYKGIDLFPVYAAYVKNNRENGFEEKNNHWANSTFACAHLVKFDLFERYGLIAAAGDRHLAEFMPGDEYLKNPETVTSWKFGLTTVPWRKNNHQEKIAEAKRLVTGQETLVIEHSGEEGILLIKALCGLERVVSNVNIPNAQGQIANLPEETIVETNAIFERDRITPVHAGQVPENVKDLMMPNVVNQELIYDAARKADFDKALQALMNDPLVVGKLTESQGREMLQSMIEKTSKYLPLAWTQDK